MPLGGASCVSGATWRVSVVGKRKDIVTPTRDAQNVPMMYNITTGFMLPSAFSLRCAMAFMTRRKTRTGATPFNALTNRSPRMDTAGIAPGAKTAIRMPMTRPTAICLMSATLERVLWSLLNNMIPPLLIKKSSHFSHLFLLVYMHPCYIASYKCVYAKTVIIE